MGKARRRQLALIACLLWLAGFEGLPWLHVAFHADAPAHVHAADGTIIRVSFGGEPTHRHADGTIHRDHGPPSRHSRTPDRPAYGLEHGAGSLAHHGVGVVPAAPPLHRPLPVDLRPVLVELAPESAPVSQPAPIASARGPPSVSFGRV